MTFDYAALEEAGIEQLLIDYHGAGDEGWIEDINPIPSEPGLESHLWEAAQRAAYSLLESNYPGWEINEGSRGTITVHVQARKADLHHGTNYEQTLYEDKEVS